MSVRALVVGGTNGIGYAMACRVAAETPSASVIISGRNKPQNIPHLNMQFRPLDASSMREIKQYTDAFKSSEPDQKLDLLIMTQGILTMAGRTETQEGIDRKMALHYYGRQLLIRELLPVLKDNAKVIIVLDGTRGNPAQLDWDDLDLKKGYSLQSAASHCISMTNAMIQHFAQQQQQTGTTHRHFMHAYPGLVSSNIATTLPWYLRAPSRVMMRVVGVSPEACAEYLLNGISKVTEGGEKQARFWSNIDEKGREVASKAIWTEDQLKMVVNHTWDTIDGAINSAA